MKTVSIVALIWAFFAGAGFSAAAAILKADDVKIAGELTFGNPNNYHLQRTDIFNLLMSVEELAKRQCARGLRAWMGPNDADGLPQVWIAAKDGWRVLVGVDYGVIEVKTGAHNWTYYLKMTSHFHALWEDLKEMGYTPAVFLGGGHLSVGLRELLAIQNLTRKFVRDFYRHNELSMGILNFDGANALPWTLLPQAKLPRLQELIDQIEGPKSLIDIQNYLQTIEDSYFEERLRQGHPHLPFREDEFAMNLEHAEDAKFPRIELKSVRPQDTYETFLVQTRMLAKRIQWLSEQPEDFSFALQTPLIPTDSNYSAPLAALPAWEAFVNYLLEIGELPLEHLAYIWPAWHSEVCERWLRQ